MAFAAAATERRRLLACHATGKLNSAETLRFGQQMCTAETLCFVPRTAWGAVRHCAMSSCTAGWVEQHKPTSHNRLWQTGPQSLTLALTPSRSNRLFTSEQSAAGRVECVHSKCRRLEAPPTGWIHAAAAPAFHPFWRCPWWCGQARHHSQEPPTASGSPSCNLWALRQLAGPPAPPLTGAVGLREHDYRVLRHLLVHHAHVVGARRHGAHAGDAAAGLGHCMGERAPEGVWRGGCASCWG